jgi:Alginate export
MNVCFGARAWAVVALALSPALAWSQPTADAGSITQSSSLTRYLRDVFSFTGEFRSRWEGGLGTDFALTPRDSYVLTRVRLGLAFKPTPWLRFFAETQDARAMFYRVTPGTGVDNPFDWRQGWVELGVAEGPGMRLRVGRQDFTLGSGRLVGSGDWTNVTKTFNLARATVTQNGFKMDIFAGSVVAIDPARMDRAKPGEHFYGSYVTLDKVLRGAAFEPYAFLKTALKVKSKDGKIGNTDTVYLGGRLAGKAPGALDYSLEAVKEVGMYADDAINAFGFAGGGGWTIPTLPWSLRLNSDYAFATGDSGAIDGHHQSFDYLYGPQSINSLTQQFAWKNIKDWRAGLDFKPFKKLTAKISFRDYWLANVRDSLYNCSGAKTITNARATSAHVGEGLDAQLVYSFDSRTSMGMGVGNLAPGSYLTQSNKTTGFIYPYLYLLRRMQ